MKRPITSLVIGLLTLFASLLAAQPTFTVSPQTVTGNVGDQFTVNILASNFTNILSFQYSMNWNSAAVQLNLPIGNVSPSALAGLTSASFGTTQSGSGLLGVSWSDPNATGVTIPNGTILYSLTFTILSSTGTNINFAGTPVPFEVINGNGQDITNVTVFQGTGVNGGGSSGGGNGGGGNGGGGNGGGGNGGGGVPTGFAVLASDETAANGAQICVDITVQDFTNILSMQYTMEFDESKWSFANIPASSFGLPGVTAASFGTTQTGQGYIAFSWSDPNAVGVTVPNGTVIYQICFNAIGANNCGVTTPFSFNSASTPIEVYNGNSQTVTFQSDPGALEICGNGGGGNGGGGNTTLTFIADDVESPTGSQICVDITADNFDCIVSAQYSIHFNQNIIQFVSVQGFGLPDLTAANFGTTQSANGTITFSWLHQSLAGATVPDGATIFQLCFNVIGSNTQVANITFDGNPTSVEVTGCVNSQAITPSFDSGTVTVGVTCAGAITVSNPVIANVGCFGQSTGSITITVAGGSATKTYEWKNAAGVVVGTSQNLTNVPAGTYTVKITSCNGNEIANAGPYTVGGPATALHIDFTSTDIACFGETNGAIDITVTGGTNTGAGCNGYTYLWSNNASTQDLSGLAAGNYTVTVTDCKGCTLISPIYIISAPPSALVMGTATVVNVKCNGGNDGSITINATGGGTNKEYRISPGAPGWTTNNVFSGLAAGSYNTQVRDQYGCVKTTPVTVTQPDVIIVQLVPTNPTQGQNNGSINTTVTGGVPPFTFSWTGPNGPIPGNPQNPTNLAAGTYCVTVTDANVCSKTKCIAVYAPMAIEASSIVKDACAGQCNGSIDVHATGGVLPYSYAWTPSTVPPIKNPTGLCPGTYSVTVTSQQTGTTVTQTFTISQPAQAPYAAGVNIGVPSSSSASDGSITITPAGGSGAPYTYAWSGTSLTTNPVFQLPEGTYTATITDGNGCTGTAGPYVLDYVPDSLQNLQVGSANSCASQSNGTITLSIEGGKPPYKYQIASPVQSFTTSQNSYTFSNLPAGNYTYTITDSGIGVDKQTKTGTVTVNATVLSLSTLEVTHATNTVLGHVDIEVAGGSQNYTYQWNNAYQGEDLFNVQPGCYDVTVFDVNSGCIQAFDNIGVGLLSGTFSEVRPDCPQQLGSLTVTPTLTGSSCAVPNLPYTYQWVSTTIGPVSNEQTADDIPPGTYIVTITDANGTSYVLTKDLASKSSLSVTADVTTDFNGYDIRCYGDNGGEAKAFASNGVQPYTYQWSNGVLDQKTTGLSVDPNNNVYTVTVTDNEGCQMTATVMLFGPSPLVSTADASSSGCSGGDSGQATVNVSGGVPTYTYHWSNGDKEKTADNLVPGENYSVTVTDFNGCTMIENVSVPKIDPLTAQAVSVPDSGGPSGEACVIVSGGTSPYTFTWNDYQTVTGPCLTEVFPGTYVVRVTDGNGCQIIKSVEVGDNTECGEVRTVITPDGDGKNEEFIIKCLSRFNKNTLEIYNRWGQLVYQTDNYNDDDLWKGTTVGGSILPDGVYFYVFNYLDPATNAYITKKGSVTVLRK